MAAPTRPKDNLLTISAILRQGAARQAALRYERCVTLLNTIKEIVAVPSSLEGCRTLLERISAELHAEQAVLILCNPLTRELEFVIHNQDPSIPKRYAEYYCDLDPTGLPDFVRGTGVVPTPSAQPAVFDLKEVVDYRRLVRSEFYNDFFKAGGIYHDLVALIEAPPSARGAVCLHRAPGQKPFSVEDAAVLDMVAPFVKTHLEKMVSTSVLSASQVSEDAGVIVCDAQGRVLYCNQTARELCAMLGWEDEAARLVAQPSFLGHGLEDVRSLPGDNRVEVAVHDIVLGQGEPGRLVTLRPRQTWPPSWSERVKERFGLSDREMQVVHRVMSGESNREIAQALFISECTVKKHLQSIAGKVGARTRTAIAHAVRQAAGLSL